MAKLQLSHDFFKNFLTKKTAHIWHLIEMGGLFLKKSIRFILFFSVEAD
jgi:hypothetical protein